MAIYRGAGGPGDATTDAANEATVASNKATEAAASASAAASSATAASNSATSASTSATSASNSAAAASSSASAASSSASSASSSASSAAASLSSAVTAKTAAETAQTAAETAETNAETAQAAAEAAQAAAELAQTGAETAETNAETAQTAAEAARDAALAALDNFDDRYLGSKSSDPTLDNDGNALVAGALYFNSADNVMKVYTGSVWVAAYVSGAGTLLAANNLSDLTNASTARTNLGLATVAATGAYSDLSGTPTLGTAAAEDVGYFATAAQGSLADSAVQPSDNISTLTNDAGYITSYTETDTLDSVTGRGASTTNSITVGGLVNNGNTTLGDASGDSVTINASTVSTPNGLNFDSNTLVIDAANNYVGVGTSSPATKFVLSANNGGTVGGAPLTVFRFNDTDDTVAPNQPTGRIEFYVNDVDASGTGIGSYIEGLAAGYAGGGYLTFATSANGATGATERMRIDSSGRVGIGTSSPDQKLHVYGNTGNTILAVGDNTLTEPYVYIKADATNNVGSIATRSNHPLVFDTNNTERMRIDSSGNVVVGSTTALGGGKVSLSADLSAVNGFVSKNSAASYGATNLFFRAINSSNASVGGLTHTAAQDMGVWGYSNLIFSTSLTATERMRIDSSGNLLIAKAARATITTDNDGSFDMNAASNFKCTPTGNFTLTFTNITSGQTGNIILVNSGGYTVSAAATTKVSTTALATISTAGTYWLSYISDGTNVFVANTGALA